MKHAPDLQQGKWDRVLPKWLPQKSYASLYLDFDEARQWLLDNYNRGADQDFPSRSVTTKTCGREGIASRSKAHA